MLCVSQNKALDRANLAYRIAVAALVLGILLPLILAAVVAYCLMTRLRDGRGSATPYAQDSDGGALAASLKAGSPKLSPSLAGALSMARFGGRGATYKKDQPLNSGLPPVSTQAAGWEEPGGASGASQGTGGVVGSSALHHRAPSPAAARGELGEVMLDQGPQ